MIGSIEHKVKFIRLSALSGAGKATSHLPENVLEVPYEYGIREAISSIFLISYLSVVVCDTSTCRI